MPSFGKTSRRRLNTCDIQLQELFNEVVKEYDCSVLCGFRTKSAQHGAFLTGKSKVEWPNSKHNSFPSEAADVVPYPVVWEDREGFDRFGAYVLETAKRMGIKVRWGGHFKSFYDGPHFELVEEA